MKRLHRIALLTTTLLLAISMNSFAQLLPSEGTLGIRSNLAGQRSVEVPYMLNETLSIAPYLGFTIVGDSDSNVEDGFKDFSVGVMPRYYMSQENPIALYAVGNLGISITSPNNSNVNSTSDFILGAGYGAEFFFAKRFSFSTDVNLNLRAGDSQTQLNTVARISATVYF